MLPKRKTVVTVLRYSENAALPYIGQVSKS